MRPLLPAAPLAAALLSGVLALTACAGAPSRSTSAPLPTTHATVIDVPEPVIAHPAGETAAWWFRDGASQAAARGLQEKVLEIQRRVLGEEHPDT